MVTGHPAIRPKPLTNPLPAVRFRPKFTHGRACSGDTFDLDEFGSLFVGQRSIRSYVNMIRVRNTVSVQNLSISNVLLDEARFRTPPALSPYARMGLLRGDAFFFQNVAT